MRPRRSLPKGARIEASPADAAAGEIVMTMPLLALVRHHLRAAIAQNGEDIDWAAAALAVRRGAGLD